MKDHPFALSSEKIKDYMEQLVELYKNHLTKIPLTESAKAHCINKLRDLDRQMRTESGFTLLMLLAARPDCRPPSPQNSNIHDIPELCFEFMRLIADPSNKFSFDINAKDQNGCTALMFVALGCSSKICENSGSLIPGRKKMMETLLQLGADIRIKNNLGETALCFFSQTSLSMDVIKKVCPFRVPDKDQKEMNKISDSVLLAVAKDRSRELACYLSYPKEFSCLPDATIEKTIAFFVDLSSGPSSCEYQVGLEAIFNYLLGVGSSSEASQQELTQEQINLLQLKLMIGLKVMIGSNVTKSYQREVDMIFHALCEITAQPPLDQPIKGDAETLIYNARVIREQNRQNRKNKELIAELTQEISKLIQEISELRSEFKSFDRKRDPKPESAGDEATVSFEKPPIAKLNQKKAELLSRFGSFDEKQDPKLVGSETTVSRQKLLKQLLK